MKLRLINNLYRGYIDSFRGLSKEVWWLALITLINRAGTMVIPFLSLYLTESKDFTFAQVGWVMTSFGLGSLIGTWVGGKLTDTFGYYRIMLSSLFLTGLGFIGLQYLESFTGFCIAIFFLLTIADMFRPAMFVALSAYSKEENKTRSVTLIRLAINLGFSVGPALGGFIIFTVGYIGLFWIDGVSCMLASMLILFILNPRKAKVQQDVVNPNPISVYRDKLFWMFFMAMILYSFIFLQLFSTIPLYYRESHLLSEWNIGLLMALNGFIIFLLEMPAIKSLEQSKYSTYTLIIFGTFLTTLSFFILNLTGWIGIVVIGMLLITIGEMIALPFSNSFALSRAKRGNQGEYMAMYSLSFSISHILAHNVSMQIAQNYGFTVVWWMITVMGILCMAILIYTKKKWLSEKK